MPKRTEFTTFTNRTEWQGLMGHREARTVLISSADIPLVDGKKIVPGGSILGSAAAGQTVLGDNAAAKIVNDATAEGILVNEVDVTNGDMEAAMAYLGTANTNKMPVAPAAAATEAMKRITFMSV